MYKFTEDDLWRLVTSTEKDLGIIGWRFGVGTNWNSVKVVLSTGEEVTLPVLLELLNKLNEVSKNKFKDAGEVTVTTNEDGECVLVSRQDEDHNILKVIWEKK